MKAGRRNKSIGGEPDGEEDDDVVALKEYAVSVESLPSYRLKKSTNDGCKSSSVSKLPRDIFSSNKMSTVALSTI